MPARVSPSCSGRFPNGWIQGFGRVEKNTLRECSTQQSCVLVTLQTAKLASIQATTNGSFGRLRALVRGAYYESVPEAKVCCRPLSKSEMSKGLPTDPTWLPIVKG